MGWTERQRAMLAEMGLRLWSGAPADPAIAVADVDADARERAAPPAVPASPPPAPRPAAVPAAAPMVARPADGAPALRPGVATPQRDAIAASVRGMDWPALRETVASCTACGLCAGRRQTVFGVGHERAHWMVVGEAPGEQEDAVGEPFVGKSGQLLDNMLRALDLSRQPGEPAQQVYIANAVKCRPPGNRNPEPVELATCEPYLLRQIELVRPRVILAMGRFAVQSLLRSSEPIGRLRGRVHRYEGVPLVVTYHPAYLLRNPEDKAKAWDDLCLAWQTVRSPAAAATPAS